MMSIYLSLSPFLFLTIFLYAISFSLCAFLSHFLLLHIFLFLPSFTHSSILLSPLIIIGFLYPFFPYIFLFLFIIFLLPSSHTLSSFVLFHRYCICLTHSLSRVKSVGCHIKVKRTPLNYPLYPHSSLFVKRGVRPLRFFPFS